MEILDVVVTLAAVALAGTYLYWRVFRRKTATGGCGCASGGGCCSTGSSEPKKTSCCQGGSHS
ncbi:hypothetical protein LGV61_10145 [Desulfurispirillum indicum]|uniref:FeoB-associated Cys-rich membrane protein n=1 Tax=Desulfurispirillum indicum TaxID=936456 RepID=UPI0012E9EA68|nr:FeoB-associated Cys-rich membrane protein [Desulfurispirillum indicum]UCZ56081.1 hypothetical protein LGV61_10145 [Desulfurispirillum indicum]